MDWVAIDGGLRTAFGYTRSEIDAITWPEYIGILDFWKKHPPIHLMIERFFGIKD